MLFCTGTLRQKKKKHKHTFISFPLIALGVYFITCFPADKSFPPYMWLASLKKKKQCYVTMNHYSVFVSPFLDLLPNLWRHRPGCVNIYTQTTATQCEHNPVKIYHSLTDTGRKAEIPSSVHSCWSCRPHTHALCVKMSLWALRMIGTLALKELGGIHFIIHVTVQLIQDVFFFFFLNAMSCQRFHYAICQQAGVN